MNASTDTILAKLSSSLSVTTAERLVAQFPFEALLWVAAVVILLRFFRTHHRNKRPKPESFSYEERRHHIDLNIPVERRQPLPPLCKKKFMTNSEREFFERLTRALPNYRVFPQVAFSSFLVSPESKKRGFWVTNQYNRLVADYVICTPLNYEVVATIELDGETHNNKKTRQDDAKRDALVVSAGYDQPLRFDASNKPSESEITEIFKQIEQHQCQSPT